MYGPQLVWKTAPCNLSCRRSASCASDPAQNTHNNDIQNRETNTAGNVNLSAQFLEAQLVKFEHRARDENGEENEGQTREVYLIRHGEVGVLGHVRRHDNHGGYSSENTGNADAESGVKVDRFNEKSKKRNGHGDEEADECFQVNELVASVLDRDIHNEP